MACTGELEIGKYHFSYTCGTGIGDGIVIHPDHLPENGLDDSEYLEAFKTALEIYPVLSAKSYVMEYAGYDLSEIGDHESILHNMDIVEKQDRLNYDKEVFSRMRHDMKTIRSGAYKKQARKWCIMRLDAHPFILAPDTGISGVLLVARNS